jgi:hypothetical protein
MSPHFRSELAHVNGQSPPAFVDHPDARARRKMLADMHRRHPQYPAEPKKSLVELLRRLSEADPHNDQQWDHLVKASAICNCFIELVDNAYAPRGPGELGQAFALIGHLLGAQMIEGQRRTAPLPCSSLDAAAL